METNPVIKRQLEEYQQSPAHQRQKYYKKTPDPLVIKRQLLEAGVPVQDEEVPVQEFMTWLEDFGELKEYYDKIVGNHFVEGKSWCIEKCLEHFLALKWVGLRPEETYIDIAAAGGIWADILHRKGFDAYHLDAAYPPGFNGRKIGVDATNTQLPAGFASALSLQCAFEMFEGDNDFLFMNEARKILSADGRLAILPVYFNKAHINLVSPHLEINGLSIDEGAIRIWRDDDMKVRFSRNYSAQAFFDRIYKNIPPMQGKIIHFTNLDEVSAQFQNPEQMVYCHFMFFCTK